MRIVRFLSLIAVIALILSISAFAAPPVITAQPQNVFLPVGTELPVTINFSIMATGEDISYNWQFSKDAGSTWSSVGSHNRIVNIGMNEDRVNGQWLWRCIVSNQDGEVSSSVVSVNVGAYFMESIPQMLLFGSQVINSIFDWVGSACSCIIDSPLLLIGVSFFALGASIAILSRLLSRS